MTAPDPAPDTAAARPDAPGVPWPRSAEAAAVVGVWALFGAVAALARAVADPVPVTWHTLAVSVAEFVPWIAATPLVFWAVRRVPLVGRRLARGLALHAALAVAVVVGVGWTQAAGLSALGPPPSMSADGPGRSRPTGEAVPPRPAPSDAGPRPERPGGPPEKGPLGLWTPSRNALLYLALLGVAVGRSYAVREAARRAEAARVAAERDRAEADRQRAEADRAHAEAEAARLGEQVAEARLGALRAQLRPHFLFNALNAVAAYAADDPATVRRIVARLSALLRRVLDADARPLLPLRDELAFARDYLDLQRVRFERLDVEEAVDPAVLDAEVPTLVLQPLVENAVEHGAAQGGGRVWVGARRDGDALVLTVGDDGPGLNGRADGVLAGAPVEGHTGIGLANTRARLEAHYGEAGRLDLRAREGGGAEAVVTLPYRDPDDDA